MISGEISPVDDIFLYRIAILIDRMTILLYRIEFLLDRISIFLYWMAILLSCDALLWLALGDYPM